MKLSTSSVFLILLGLFVAFCMFSHVKIRLTEGMSHVPKPPGSDDMDSDKEEEDEDDAEGFTADPRKLSKPKKPTFMDPKKRVKKVETFVSGSSVYNGTDYTCFSASGRVKSVFGCCSDGMPMTDASGSNCAAAVSCNYGMCPEPNSKTCKLDAEGSNCTSSSGVMCLSVNGPVKSGYGCCMDGSPMSDAAGTNCAAVTSCNYGMCANSTVCKVDSSGSNCTSDTSNVVACNYGTCPNSTTCKVDTVGSNCSEYPPPLPQSCGSTIYGCCPDGFTTKNADGSNCSAVSTSATAATTATAATATSSNQVQPTEMYAGVTPYNTSTVFIPPPLGGSSLTSNSTSNCPKPESGSSSTSNCPKPEPCPPCGRCPEAAFECKKVPNYERTDNERFVPQAILTDFSTFGM